MLKIGDFSRLSRVSVKALRYYDEIGLLKPVSVDQFSGYRYYSAEQLPRLNRILVLKELGLSLEEVAVLAAEDLPQARITELLQAKQTELRQRLNEDHSRLAQLEQLLNAIAKEGTMPAYDITLKKLDAQKVACVRAIIPTYSDIPKLFDELFGQIGRFQSKFAGAPVALYHDLEFKERDADVEIAMPIRGDITVTGRLKMHELPAVASAACTIHKGSFDQVGDAYKALMSWIEANRYQMAGPAREVYLQGPGPGVDPSSYVTEIQLPVEKAK
ncbi:MAG: MerR family transcriptional regulator [Chloroflexota bacterium]